MLIPHEYTKQVQKGEKLFFNWSRVFLERIDVFSPEIASIWYDKTKHMLQVEFHNLCIYNYYEVPQQHYEQCVCADSVEQYFQANIENYFESDRIL